MNRPESKRQMAEKMERTTAKSTVCPGSRQPVVGSATETFRPCSVCGREFGGMAVAPQHVSK